MGYKIIKIDEQLIQITVAYDTGHTMTIDLPIDENGNALNGAELDMHILGLCPPTLLAPVANAKSILNLIDAEYLKSNQITESELLEHNYNQALATRNKKLSDSDWTQLSDAKLSDLEKVVWGEYRQMLRDLPTQQGFPNQIVYPIAPNEEAR